MEEIDNDKKTFTEDWPELEGKVGEERLMLVDRHNAKDEVAESLVNDKSIITGIFGVSFILAFVTAGETMFNAIGWYVIPIDIAIFVLFYYVFFQLTKRFDNYVLSKIDLYNERYDHIKNEPSMFD